MQELEEKIKNHFPKLKDKQINSVLNCLKYRCSTFTNNIYITRLKPVGNIGQKTFQKIIYFLRDEGVLVFVKQVVNRKKTGFKNVYKIGDKFLNFFYTLKDFTKKIFEYINVLEFVKSHFTTYRKSNLLWFRFNGVKYFVTLQGKYANNIYCVGTGIPVYINPYELKQQINKQ